MAAKKKTKKYSLPTHKPGMRHSSNRGKKAAKKTSKKAAKKRCKPCKPGTTRRAAAPKAKKSKAHHTTMTAADLLKNVAAKRGKRWTCGGPVRTGCGGSGSRVVNKVR